MKVYAVRLYEWDFELSQWIGMGDPIAYDLSRNDAMYLAWDMDKELRGRKEYGLHYDYFIQPVTFAYTAMYEILAA